MRVAILSLWFLILLTGWSFAHCTDAPAHPWLGVMVETVPLQKLDELGLDYGVEVKKVIPESPAEEAGIEKGDIILKVNDRPVYSPKRLRWIVEHSPVDEEIPLLIFRDHRTKELTVRLQEVNADWGPYFRRFPFPDRQHSYLGVKLQPLTPELRKYFGVKEDLGVLVASVKKNSPAEDAGIRAGDVIIRMDRRRIRSIRDVHRVLAFFEPGEEIEIRIIRDGKEKSVKVKLGKTRRFYPETFFYRAYGPEELEIEIDPESITRAMEILRETLSELREFLTDPEADCEMSGEE